MAVLYCGEHAKSDEVGGFVTEQSLEYGMMMITGTALPAEIRLSAMNPAAPQSVAVPEVGGVPPE